MGVKHWLPWEPVQLDALMRVGQLGPSHRMGALHAAAQD